MSITTAPLASGTLTTGAVTYYTSPTSVTTVIKAFTANNKSGGVAKYTAILFNGTGLIELISTRSLNTKENDLGDGLIGRTLLPGMYLQLLSDTASAIDFWVDGVQFI